MSDTGAGVQWVDTAEEEVVVVVTEDDTAAGRLEGPEAGPGFYLGSHWSALSYQWDLSPTSQVVLLLYVVCSSNKMRKMLRK